jgi:hypothetical protein
MRMSRMMVWFQRQNQNWLCWNDRSITSEYIKHECIDWGPLAAAARCIWFDIIGSMFPWRSWRIMDHCIGSIYVRWIWSNHRKSRYTKNPCRFSMSFSPQWDGEFGGINHQWITLRDQGDEIWYTCQFFLLGFHDWPILSVKIFNNQDSRVIKLFEPRCLRVGERVNFLHDHDEAKVFMTNTESELRIPRPRLKMEI